MKFDAIDSINEVFSTLSRNRSRTFLTGFGVFRGLFMLLFLIGGGRGLKQLLFQNFDGFATNTCMMFADRTSKPYKGFKEGRVWALDLKDIERTKMLIPELDVVTPVVSRWGSSITYGTYSADGAIKGITPDFYAIEPAMIGIGRSINNVDIAQERKVCVIGKKIYTTLFPDGGDPCGKFIRVGSSYFQVIGVDFASGNISINGSADESVSIPLPVAQKLYHCGTVIDMLCVTGKEGVKVSSLEPEIREALGRAHNFDPEDKRAVFLLNTEEMFTVIDNLFKGVNFLVWLVGLGTLIAGAIGVSNIMMVTVRERTTEIGIRRAIGATPWDILSQIIFESIFLTFIAGLGGIVFSVGMLSGLELITSKPGMFQIGFTTALMAAVLLAMLGVLAGLAPASRAMNIKPVDAMRDE